MKVKAKYMLLVVALAALIALWYLKRQGYLYEGFAEKKEEAASGKTIFENFNDAQKEIACKTLAEQMKLYTEMLKTPASTDEEREMQKGIAKTVETLKEEQMKQSCVM